MKSVQSPLTNMQLELLKIFSRNLNEQDLMEVKKLLADFFARKAIEEADKVWENKNYSDIENALLQEHLRASKNLEK